jgi:small subunit ribosomal protein S8
MVNDTISDMLTRIRNANLAYKNSVCIPNTNIHRSLCEILEREGFIEKFSFEKNDENQILLYLKYQRNSLNSGGSLGKPSITNLKRISKPGLRIYTNHKDVPQILGGMGILIISTSKGLMTDREARKSRIGGEILCSIW